jgi:hypothetical protein
MRTGSHFDNKIAAFNGSNGFVAKSSNNISQDAATYNFRRPAAGDSGSGGGGASGGGLTVDQLEAHALRMALIPGAAGELCGCGGGEGGGER